MCFPTSVVVVIFLVPKYIGRDEMVISSYPVLSMGLVYLSYKLAWFGLVVWILGNPV